jgi:hypothetical protein
LLPFGNRATIARQVEVIKFALSLVLAVLLCAPLAGADLQPADISPAGLTAARPSIATDGKGNVIATWREVDGDAWAIRAAVRPKGGGWTSKRISDLAPAIESPELAMDRLGNAVVLWQRTDVNGSVVQAAVRPAGGDWSDVEDLSATTDLAFEPAVSAENGRLAALWVVLRNRHTYLMSSSRSIVGDWSPAETLAGPVGNPGSPGIALDDDGAEVAAWLWSNGAHQVVEAASRAPAGSWSTPTVLSRPDRTASRPRLAMDSDGHAIAGWVRTNGDWTIPEAASRASDGTWGQPVSLSNRAGNVRALDLDMTRDGHAIAVWRQGSPHDNLWSSSRPAGTTAWGDPSPIIQDWPGVRADVTLDEEGNATAVWTSDATASASFKPVGQPWQEDYLLSSYDDSAAAPAVAAYGPKVATAVWIRAGEEDDRIQSVDYDINTSAQEAGGEGGDGGDDGFNRYHGHEVRGTAHADRLVGTPGKDVFYGLGGNDTIVGRGGRDLVFGGPGNDRIVGGAGADRLYGGRGDDVIVGGRGADFLNGNAGRDRLAGGLGGDFLVGGTGHDLLGAGPGDDTVLGKDGFRDVVDGGRGRDQYRLDRWLDRARSIESRFH